MNMCFYYYYLDYMEEREREQSVKHNNDAPNGIHTTRNSIYIYIRIHNKNNNINNNFP